MNFKEFWLKLTKIDKIVLVLIISVIILITFMITYPEQIPRNKTQSHFDAELQMFTWSISYNFKTTSYSAHNDIHLEVTAQPYNNYTKFHKEQFDNVETIQVHIPNSYVDEPAYENGMLRAYVMELKDDDNNGIFEGEETLQFDSGGEKCFIIKENEREEASLDPCNNDTQPVIEISDPERLLELRTDKTILLLSLFFSIGVIIQVRNWYVRAINQDDLDGKMKENTIDKTTRFIPMNKKKKPKRSNPPTKHTKPNTQHPNPDKKNEPKS